MRMISHFHHQLGRAGETQVAIRYFSLECELSAMRGVRIPQLALTLTTPGTEPDTESVDLDPDLMLQVEQVPNAGGWQPLLNRLAGRYGGRPMGDLAERAAGLLVRAG
jgi:hypothetical protein